MTINDYYSVLGLDENASIEDIKKAYRRRARECHPDLNQSPDATEQFINITEAYDFLVSNIERIRNADEEYEKAMENWRKYRQDRSRRRANVYSRTTYVKFKNTGFYKSTKIFDGTAIIFSFLVSILVLTYTISGYIYRLHNPLPGLEKPSIFMFLMLMGLGIVFFIISLIYLRAYIETSRMRKRKQKHVA
jgi:curved DNA-binding protein CbpA